jgi:hypothetical protein
MVKPYYRKIILFLRTLAKTRRPRETGMGDMEKVSHTGLPDIKRGKAM